MKMVSRKAAKTQSFSDRLCQTSLSPLPLRLCALCARHASIHNNKMKRIAAFDIAGWPIQRVIRNLNLSLIK